MERAEEPDEISLFYRCLARQFEREERAAECGAASPGFPARLPEPPSPAPCRASQPLFAASRPPLRIEEHLAIRPRIKQCVGIGPGSSGQQWGAGLQPGGSVALRPSCCSNHLGKTITFSSSNVIPLQTLIKHVLLETDLVRYIFVHILSSS